MIPFDFQQDQTTIWWVGLAFSFGIIPVCYAIGMYFLAPRMNANRPLWVVLALIPYVNWAFQIYVGFRVMFLVLDHLAEIKAALARRSAIVEGGQ